MPPNVSQSINDARQVGSWFKRRRALMDQLRVTPQFTCVSGPCRGDQAFVDQVPFRLGRGHNNQLVLSDPGAAGLHAIVTRNGLGNYTIVSAKPDEYPVYVRRFGRFKVAGHLRLQDRMVIRLGRRGPQLRFRYLGEREARSSIVGSVLGGGQQEELLPDSQVRTRLEQMWQGGRLAETDRHYVHQAARHLGTLHTYRRWLLTGAVLLIAITSVLVYHRLVLDQKKVELARAREQLGQKWSWSQTASQPVQGGQAQPNDDDRSSMLLSNDRTARGITTIMTGFGIEHPHVSVNFVNLVKLEIDHQVEHLLRDTDLEGFLDRYRKYHPRIEEIFKKEYQLPPSLAYVAWIESEYYTDAESEKGALGMWQFMAPSAAQYGLITDKGEDFRQDFETSTRAAARYMSDLLAQFGMDQFMIALVAYNWGPDNVLGVFRKYRLWQPPQRTLPFILGLRDDKGVSALPEETQSYVPRFFAANLIGSDMSFYLGR